MRFQLKIYKKRKPKGKATLTRQYARPMDARRSQAAQEAAYYEIVDLTDKRVVEVKTEVNDGR